MYIDDTELWLCFECRPAPARYSRIEQPAGVSTDGRAFQPVVQLSAIGHQPPNIVFKFHSCQPDSHASAAAATAENHPAVSSSFQPSVTVHRIRSRSIFCSTADDQRGLVTHFWCFQLNRRSVPYTPELTNRDMSRMKDIGQYSVNNRTYSDYNNTWPYRPGCKYLGV